VTCDDGRRGLLSGESCHLARRHAIEPVAAFERDHGIKSSVRVGPGVFIGQGNGVVPLDDPNTPNKTRCAVLDGVSYCY